jgi:hypothetical protein
MNSIQNTNNVSVKTESAAELVRELSKLGVFRKKGKKKSKRSSDEEIRQDNEMIGYTRSLGGPQMRNIPPIQQITAGMSQQQIEDIQSRNDAAVAALRAEVEQHRSETQSYLPIVSQLVDIASERFRGAQEPGAGQRINPFVQSTTIEEIPDITEERSTKSPSAGAPDLSPQRQETLYAGGDLPEGIPFLQIGDVIPAAMGGGRPFEPQPKIGGGRRVPLEIKNRDAKAIEKGLQPVPPINGTTSAEMKSYYESLMSVLELPVETFKTKRDYHKAINDELDRII